MVYVDTMKAKFGPYKMCHMIADTSEELHAMADTIGVGRKWCQMKDTPREHYDIAMTKKALAVSAGAIEVTKKDLVRLLNKTHRYNPDTRVVEHVS
jgi:hypothetical protein